ncbi:SAM-dependent methyltransferase [Frankia sp. AgB1.9]|uniref:SAM-dependent methyltransferase n=1 Tax=unclassified Frankia TaxID=2632575 RepID=UPI001933FDEE|nr:SAM-dependent methyltransferase [Frankia sp. AgW1.1]MBL7549784.1 SAM-dependent methyltransferase [Frankia sp. AgB1.9]MBL7622906.1 SAM-dependent methyltransferase [Frankia sp. AgB1.8]
MSLSDGEHEADEPSPVGGRDDTLIRRRARPTELHTDRPHSARMYDYYLDGKTNYPADREAAEQVLATFPSAGITARQNRAFLGRATRHLAQAGVEQFLDVGAGIPTSPNLHEVAQSVTPRARVVYADNDPIVLAHARALLASSPEGATAYLEADLRRPADILASHELAETLDLSRPVGLSLLAVLHFVPDADDPTAIVRELVDALPAGSYLMLSHATADFVPAETTHRNTDVYQRRGIPFQARDRAQVAALVPDTMEIIDPGVTSVHRWHPDAQPADYSDAEISTYGLVARKR